MEFQLDQAITMLGRTPATLRALLQELPAQWLDENEGGETWSPTVILGHLIHAEDADWIPRARTILAHGEAEPFEPFDRLAQFEKFRGVSTERLLEEFAARRQENLTTLREMKLTAEQLDLKGRHPELGVVTLGQLLATWVVHDLTHLRQIARVMAKQYADAVGPWKAYLSILSE